MLDHQTSLMNERPTSTNLHVLNMDSLTLPACTIPSQKRNGISANKNEYIPKQNGVTGHVSQYEVPVPINPVARRTANQLADTVTPATTRWTLLYTPLSQLLSAQLILYSTGSHYTAFRMV